METSAPHEGVLRSSGSHAQTAWLFSFQTGFNGAPDVDKGEHLRDGIYKLLFAAHGEWDHETGWNQAPLLGHRLRHHRDVFNTPQVGGQPRLHGGGVLDAAANLAEVVDHEIEADRMHAVLKPEPSPHMPARG